MVGSRGISPWALRSVFEMCPLSSLLAHSIERIEAKTSFVYSVRTMEIEDVWPKGCEVF